MADGGWLLIFRSFSTEDLLDKRDALIGSMTTLASQSIGSKSITRDLRELKSQLEAIIFVLNERGTPCGYPRSIVFDFSGGTRGQRAGTEDQLS
jgi:hypothetical protein